MIFGITHKTESSADFQEHRTALCPCGVGTLIQAGHEVLVEAHIGEGNGFPDEDFQRQGARVLHSFEEVVRRAQVVLRVAPPGERVRGLLKPGQVFCSLLQYGLDEMEVASQFARCGATAVALELLKDGHGHQPVFGMMSEIAGAMMPHIAAHYLQSFHGGRGLLLGGITGQPPAHVVILGAGALGRRATREFLGVGAQVELIDTDIEALHQAELELQYRANTLVSTPLIMQRVPRYADVLVCAVNLMKSPRRPVVTREMVACMKPGSVIIDASIDQGGGVETSRITTQKDPVFVVHDVVHYCVPNISALVPRTASRALDSVVAPFLLKMGRTPDLSALYQDEHLRRAVYVKDGVVVPELVAPFAGKVQL